MGSARDAALMVMGPASRQLLSQLTDADLSKESAPWMSAAEIAVAGRPATALRVSYVGELGWEFHLASADLAAVYGAIREAGADLGLADFGSYALNAMRLEKGYHAWGLDFGTEYTVFDAGLENFVKFDKPGFVGRDAVLCQRERDPDWSFHGFIVEGGDTDPLPSDPIFRGDEWVGYVTSGGTGFRINRRLALGYIKRSLADAEPAFEIEVLGERRTALRVPRPFYDPENERLRG
jgi:dimethylglycine dehydrogenase